MKKILLIESPSFADEHIKDNKKGKNYKKYKIAALIFALLFIWSNVSHVIALGGDHEITSFTADKYEVDVGEPVNFTWSVTGNYTTIWINFGDGSPNFQCNNETFSTTHVYSEEGSYNVTIYAVDKYGNKEQRALGIDQDHPYGRPIIVKNKAPDFEISFSNNQPYEDELITISVPSETLIESDHDKLPGKLTYIYDTADSSDTGQITTNESSIQYAWENAGKYPVSVTVIDDQGALKQKTKYITVVNKPPEAAFTLGAEIPATWSFSNDKLQRIPLGWSEDAPDSRSSIKVIQGKDTHSKVLEITGNEYQIEPRIRRYIGTQYFGTVEYWFQTTNATGEWGYLSLKSDGTEVISVFTNNSKWYYRANSITDIIDYVADPVENQWTHIRIDYLTDKSWLPGADYFGLNEDNEFQVIIDGVISDDYSIAPAINSIDSITLGSHTKCLLGKAYIDSIGTTSDPNYNVGMNYNYFVSSYYGTHDFRFDIIGKQPSGWDIDDYSAETTGNYYGTDSFLEGDIGGHPTGWDVYTDYPCYVQVKDNFNSHKTPVMLFDNDNNGIAQITYNFDTAMEEGYFEYWWAHLGCSRTYIYPSFGSNIAFKMCTDIYAGQYQYKWMNLYPVKVYKSNVWYHHRIYFNCYNHKWKWWINDEYLGEFNFFDDSVDYLNKLKIFTDPGQYSYYSHFDAFGFPFEDPDYELGDNKYSPLEIKVVDAGGDHKEVVRICDKDPNSGVKMTDNIKEIYGEQTSGTIQWYAKSSNTQEKVWALRLADGGQTEVAIAMGDGCWQYSTGDNFINMTELPTPQNNVWYPLSLHFDDISGKFTLSVNGTISNQYNLGVEFDKISKVIIESGNQAKGTAWLDAIAYSFDPLYNIDDYLVPMVSYPEKTKVQFSAADSVDTESDLNSLRYYWQFGDGTSGFGKLITHEFKQSGRYNVSLAVKDDNGDIDCIDQVVRIHNTYPEIEVICQNHTIEIYEGQTIAINCISTDEIVDWAELMHFWDFNSTMGSLSEEEYENGGWRKTHLFKDDFEGNAGVMVKDPEGANDMSYANVLVKNVDPLISIYDASLLTNISFEVYRNSISKEANFTFEVRAHNHSISSSFLTFEGSEENSIFSDKTQIDMTLCKEWEVFVNSTQLPSNSWFRYYVRLQFLNGETLIISSEKFYGDGSNYGEWDTYLNPYFYDTGNYHYKFPLTLKTQVWDPSVDDINLTLTLTANYLLEISCNDSLPIEQSFIKQFSFGTVNYTVNIYEESNNIYANISATYTIANNFYDQNTFPVDLGLEFTIYPVIDLYDILQDELALTQLSILACMEAHNYINTTAIDDDLGSNSLAIIFETGYNIEFLNLAPEISALIAKNGSTTRDINFYVQIEDFNQKEDLGVYYTSNFKDDNVPDVPDDFNIINGTLEEPYGDLSLVDNSNAIFTSNYGFNYRKQITIDHTKVDSTLSNFPLMVSITDTDLASKAQNDGDDIYFTQSDGISKLDHEIEYYNNTTGLLIVWIRIPTLSSSTDTEIYMYYGDPYCETNENPESVWDSNFKTVLHLQETSGTHDDSTSNNNDGTAYNGVDQDEQGQIGGADKFDGTNDYVSTPLDIDQGGSYSYTFSCWVYPTSTSGGTYHLISSDNGGYDWALLRNGGTWEICTGPTKVSTGKSVDINTWQHVAVVFIPGTGVRFYKNGVQWTSSSIGYDSSDNPIAIGCNPVGAEYFAGIADEIRVSKTTRSADWIETSYDNQNDPNSFYSVGSEEAGPNCSVSFETVFQMDTIEEGEIIKFLSLQYAASSNISTEVEVSLYNFHTELWDPIGSQVISAQTCKEHYSVLSSEYFNLTYHVLARIEVSGSSTFQFSLDQLKIEYFSIIITESNDFENEEVPVSFSITSGTITSQGDLYLQDNSATSLKTSDPDPPCNYVAEYSFEDDDDESDP
ncbi:MAG: DUF2341 domain-containing protein, partial [Candidatus Hodarchaeota archaeon]